MNTVSDIFDVFGGNAAVARILGVGASTASEMKRRESIPVEYWPALVDEAKKIDREDVSLERIAIVMAEAGARRRSAKSSEVAA
ncbi:hypothetical protein QO002_002149 [Pararhizobium capsulatum DSM 1112]|uniref:Uncharacterized protein n=1 Tax=Pararhizobium capsulatum DSM 1112 TaxID=1121113 RepID=A0ABU0BP27_9HYPH|nr:hypothetical protein [Pararhizobium capsulatum]MDQ0320011.1 hypothetical protein [Pararhizobium capsulatum DSM 1112]